MQELAKLFSHGHKVEILDGRLIISPEVVQSIDKGALLFEIATVTSTELLIYQSYSAGAYQGKYKGVTLQFNRLLSEQGAYAVFNANIVRQRNSKKGKKGERLPNGHFNVSENSEFYKFWKRCHLSRPASLTRFWDRMGNLKKVILTGSYTKGERLDSKSLEPVNLSYKEIKECFNDSQTHKERITNAQAKHKERIRPTHKETDESHTEQGLQAEQGTGRNKYGNKVIRERGNKGNDSISISTNKKSPQEQTNEEWIRELEQEDWDELGMDSMNH